MKLTINGFLTPDLISMSRLLNFFALFRSLHYQEDVLRGRVVQRISPVWQRAPVLPLNQTVFNRYALLPTTPVLLT